MLHALCVCWTCAQVDIAGLDDPSTIGGESMDDLVGTIFSVKYMVDPMGLLVVKPPTPPTVEVDDDLIQIPGLGRNKLRHGSTSSRRGSVASQGSSKGIHLFKRGIHDVVVSNRVEADTPGNAFARAVLDAQDASAIPADASTDAAAAPAAPSSPMRGSPPGLKRSPTLGSFQRAPSVMGLSPAFATPVIATYSPIFVGRASRPEVREVKNLWLDGHDRRGDTERIYASLNAGTSPQQAPARRRAGEHSSFRESSTNEDGAPSAAPQVNKRASLSAVMDEAVPPHREEEMPIMTTNALRKALSMTLARVIDMFRKFDADGSGSIDLKEVCGGRAGRIWHAHSILRLAAHAL